MLDINFLAITTAMYIAVSFGLESRQDYINPTNWEPKEKI